MTKHILMVEDQEDNRQILRDLLGNYGFHLSEAENGEQAFAAIAKRRPDLILMDIQLPVMEARFGGCRTTTMRITRAPFRVPLHLLQCS